jgi:alpha-glucosidase (family GH31 glycosyl hydrolase)
MGECIMKNECVSDFSLFSKTCHLMVIISLLGLCGILAMADQCVIPLLEGENFWGGCVTDGRQMPLGKTAFKRDLYGDNRGNQSQPLLISDQGRYVWCEQPFEFSFVGTQLKIESKSGKIETGKKGDSLRQAYQYVSRTYFPSTGEIPNEMLFTKPQYNTWIELIYDQRESRIRKYADDILGNGFPAGVLMIDDNWQEDYGVWEFHPGRFTNPKDMMKTLHKQGFKVMLWICPFFSPDCETYRLLNKKGFFLKDKRGGTFMTSWWNGYSASLDLTNPEAVKYFQGRLAYLCNEYGVDGFKLDAGDADFYADQNIKSAQAVSPNDFCEQWGKLGLPFNLNEYRACWKLAGQPLAQRLRDKGHNWEDLHQLIPDALAQGLMGYAYICPDMIGGGEYSYFYDNPDKPLDQELIVRSTQCSALMPMMQFSVAPWRVLSKENMAICRNMALLHEKMGPEILTMVKSAAQSGEPVVRHLEYMYPHQGYAQIKDQFLLGDDILVAPVLEKGARSRKIVFPAGTWKGDDDSVATGPCTMEVNVPLERLPWYRCIKRAQ